MNRGSEFIVFADKQAHADDENSGAYCMKVH